MTTTDGLAWLKTLVRSDGLTQRGLAQAMDIDVSAVSRLLSGSRRIQAFDLPKISQYVGVSVEELSQRLGVIAPHYRSPNKSAAGRRLLLQINQEVTPDQAARIYAILDEKP